MVSAEAPGGWVKYVNEYCFVTGTFLVESDVAHMPQGDDLWLDNSKKVDVSYYQWIPYVFAIQALCFYLPNLFWEYFQKSETDVDFQFIVERCTKSRQKNQNERDEDINEVVETLVKTYEHRGEKGLGSVGMKAYMASKLLYLINVIVQFYALLCFVGHTDFGWGFSIIADALRGIYWDKNGYFPRVSYCTYKQNTLGQVQSRTVQCVLMLNFIHEKLFVLLYLWFIILAVLTLFNFFLLIVNFSALGRRRAVKKYLIDYKKKEAVNYNAFANLNLGDDGLLLIKFIENNAGLAIATEVANKYYEAVRQKKMNKLSSRI